MDEALGTHMRLVRLAGRLEGSRRAAPAALLARRSVPGCRRAIRVYATQTQAAEPKLLWVQTGNQAAFTTAVECGLDTFVFEAADSKQLVDQWSKLAAFRAILSQHRGDQQVLEDQDGQRLGIITQPIQSAQDVSAIVKLRDTVGAVVMDCTDWRVIPAENLIAAFQDHPARLLAAVTSADEGRVMLEALEAGTDGVLLRTADSRQVRELAAYVRRRNAAGAGRLHYQRARVTRIAPVGMGDRVCVDLCCLLAPGEGLLVGSFARALFLVHSECAPSAYIASRPFRVNAGPVHAYVAGEAGRTAYLSELASSAVVTVADAQGRQRPATVGRAKVEQRPLVLVEAQTEDGMSHSIMLQNAETVRLVGPDPGGDCGLPVAADDPPADSRQSADGSNGRPAKPGRQQGAEAGWRALSVSELQEGDDVYICRQDGARHTGIKIDEKILEK